MTTCEAALGDVEIGRPHTIDELRDFFREPEHEDWLRAYLAFGMQANLGRYLETGLLAEPTELTDGLFEAAFDPTLPTIAVDISHAMKGNELLGIAARSEETPANIVYVATSTGDAKIVTDHTLKSVLGLSGGIMILPSGQVVHGRFPRAVRADLLEGFDHALLTQCQAAGIPTTYDSAVLESMNDKCVLPSLVRTDKVSTPERIDADTFLAADDVSGLAIKPTNSSQGLGVILTDECSNPDSVKTAYRFMQAKGYELVVEKRIRSYPFIDPTSGERLDWNVRALIDHGKVLGMYIRANVWGQPVNMAENARAIAIEEIPFYVADKMAAALIAEKLSEAASALAADLDCAFTGADITVDEAFNAQLFELNYGFAGGLQTMAAMERAPEAKIQAAQQLLQGWLQQVTPRPGQTSPVEGEVVPLSPSLTTLALHGSTFAARSPLPHMDLTELPWRSRADGLGIRVILLSARDAALNSYDNDIAHGIDELLLDHFPLEIRKLLPAMLDNAPRPINFLGLITTNEELFPHDKAWSLLHGQVRAYMYDLPGMRQAYIRSLEKGATREQFQAYIGNASKRIFEPYMCIMPDIVREELLKAAVDSCLLYCSDGEDAAIEALGQQAIIDGGAMSRLSLA